MTPFTFFLDWELNCQFAGLIWARDRGLYAERGIDVRFVAPRENPQRPVVDLVLAQAPAAGCMEDNLIVRAALAGHGLRAVGAMLQASPIALMTAPASGITRLGDLPGRRVAMHADGIHLLHTLLKLHGIDPGGVETNVGSWSLDDLMARRFDAVQGYSITEADDLARRGLKVRLIPLRHAELRPYSQVIFAAQSTISQHPDLLRDFLAATFDGWRQAMTRRDEAAALIAAVSEEHADVDRNCAILDAMQPLVGGDVGLTRAGALDPERWRRNLATYARFGMVDREAAFDEVADDRFLRPPP